MKTPLGIAFAFLAFVPVQSMAASSDWIFDTSPPYPGVEMLEIRDEDGALTGDIADDYATMASIGFDRNPKFTPGGPGGWNDPDMLEVGNGGMSRDEHRTHMGLWAVSAAPLIMGHDVRAMDAETLDILTNREARAIFGRNATSM